MRISTVVLHTGDKKIKRCRFGGRREATRAPDRIVERTSDVALVDFRSSLLSVTLCRPASSGRPAESTSRGPPDLLTSCDQRSGCLFSSDRASLRMLPTERLPSWHAYS